jgi:hypothetical protein
VSCQSCLHLDTGGVVIPATESDIQPTPDRPAADPPVRRNAFLQQFCTLEPGRVAWSSKAIRGGSVHECLDWLAHYVEVGARHLILRIGAFDARPEMIAERLLPALRSLAPSE